MLVSNSYKDHASWFIVLEGIVNLTLVLEVFIRMSGQGQAYWKVCSNAFDFIVMTFCVSAFLAYLRRARSTASEADDVTIALLRVFRDISQFLRLMLFVKNRHHANQLSEEPLLDLTFGGGDHRVLIRGASLEAEMQLMALAPPSDPHDNLDSILERRKLFSD
eukprot:c2390_g1_i1.p1 GENE.c2390_g1_i1~~c2390_g1_i1.p1  ORF type:complete len:163 (+),score=33.62 c2390_g1_i1:233-721(+)